MNAAASKPRRIILDVDPGIDDAMAILLALHSPELRVEAITTVSGNVMVDLGTENALKLLELAGRPDVPVARGAKYPLLKKPTTALIHGENGLGEVELPAPSKPPDPRHAADLLIDIVSANPGEITLIMVGPLTNLALALSKVPDIRHAIPAIILMGGSISRGNVTPVAEFNISTDAEAAKIVFDSGIPITMVDLEATAQAMLTRAHLVDLHKGASPIAVAAAAMLEHYLVFEESIGMPGAPLHDPLAVGLAIDKGFATRMQPMRIDIETKGEFTYGQTVANRTLRRSTYIDAGDHYKFREFAIVEPNAEVPVIVDGTRFLEFFLDRMLKPGDRATG
jgi:inosine-uridine nucleoside N-ribohydrolase